MSNHEEEPRTRFSLTLPTDMLAAIKTAQDQDHRPSRNNMIEVMLAEELARRAAQRPVRGEVSST